MKERLTPTQRFILKTAAANKKGMVGFAMGDRQGTRIKFENKGTAYIAAYANPQFFLKCRGFLEHVSGSLHKITPDGYAAVGIKRAPRK